RGVAPEDACGEAAGAVPPGVREYATPGWAIEPRWGRRASPYLPRRGLIAQHRVAYSRTLCGHPARPTRGPYGRRNAPISETPPLRAIPFTFPLPFARHPFILTLELRLLLPGEHTP